MQEDQTKKIVKEFYREIAVGGGCCGCGCKKKAENQRIAQSIGYSDQDIGAFAEANLGLGCGNPTAMAEIKAGDTVLDLGSGAGFDAFIAARKVGETGKVIGVDMTEEMVIKASQLAEQHGFKNVEFKLGDIEKLPLADGSIDKAISNCVINLAPDKAKVFREVYRVLKPGGSLYVSDIVLLEELTPEQRSDEELIGGCVGGALLRDEYLKLIEEAGFKVKIMEEDKDISKRQYQGIPLESLKVEASK